MRETAVRYLREALGQPDAEFRPGQWESIDALLAGRRLLVVQRTGWGKSMVYFLATRLLRDRGAGLTLLISPLLALMRNQIQAAKRIGVQAASIDSTNRADWEQIEARLADATLDVLLVSPERLANEEFRQNVLSTIAGHVGLFVVDEAHCISDWGHDFRPDYRRIVRVLQALPGNIPVLATTATANSRVVEDVEAQLGEDVEIVRGPLARRSLRLQNTVMPSPAARMAWLARTIHELPGSGIVYALTTRDAERVADWLRINGIRAAAYHARLGDPEEGPPARASLEQKLLDNEVKVLVATVALGMGFDKPDLGFVIHFQRPGSVVHYYQQVGRAGRAVDEAYGILLHGEEDDRLADFFIRNAFPPQQHVDVILDVLRRENDGLSSRSLEEKLNLRSGALKKALKFLSVESPAPVTKIGSKWSATAASETYVVDRRRVEGITAIRRAEQAEMGEYMAHDGCLMEFLARALDDASVVACGQCEGCIGEPLLSTEYDTDLANRAAVFLRRSYQALPARKAWPSGDPMSAYGFSGRIEAGLRVEEGRALCLWRDAGWGQLVASGKYESGRFDDELVDACVQMMRVWAPEPAPIWVTCVPSMRHAELVPEFAQRLASALGLPFSECISRERSGPQQKEMENSYQQARNLDGAFGVREESLLEGPCLLVDDVTDSGWTFTVAGALIRRAGCPAVVPLALALNSPRMD